MCSILAAEKEEHFKVEWSTICYDTYAYCMTMAVANTVPFIRNHILSTNGFLKSQKYVYEISRTTIVSWCFPSNGKNSRMHTSKLPEFTFSNQTYIASSGFVLRAYLAETNTEGLPPKLCKLKKLMLQLQHKNNVLWLDIVPHV